MLFGRKSGDPVAVAETEFSDLTRRSERLQVRLTEAETELTAAEQAQRRLLIEGDDDAAMIERAGDKVHGLLIRIAGLRDALAELTGKRQAAERALAVARDKAERERISSTMLDAHRTIETRLGAFRRASADLAGSLLTVSAAQMSAKLLDQFTEAFGGHVAGLLADLESRRGQVLSGTTGPLSTILVGEAAAPTEVITPAPAAIEHAEALYALTFLRWREGTEIKTAAAYSDVRLPGALVQRALAANLIDHFGSERVRLMMRAYGRYTGLPPRSDDGRCIDVDALDEPIESAAEVEEAAA